MTEANKVVITIKGFSLHKKLKNELLQDFTQIPMPKNTSTPSPATPQTLSLYQSIARAGYFRPKKPSESEVHIQQPSVCPNYLKRDAKEYPPLHCCAWNPKSTTNDAKIIPTIMPRTKHIHHTLFDSGKFLNTRESPTVKSVNETVFGKRAATPINLISTDSFNFGTTHANKKSMTEIDDNEKKDDNLQTSGITTMSKILSPLSTRRFGSTKGFGRTQTSYGTKAERYREKFELTQKNFHSLQVKIDEIAKKKRSWYQENVLENNEVVEKIKEGASLLKIMDTTNHREEMRHAVRLSSVHNKYENGWRKMQVLSRDKKEKQEQVRPSSKLKQLLVESKVEMSRVVSMTPNPIRHKKDDFIEN